MTRTITAALSLLALAGCGDQYRYPCQNPDNWNRPFCQKPLCDVNRTCPEHIFKGADASKMFPPGTAIPESLRSLQGSAPVATIPARPTTPPPPGACR